MKTLNNVFAGVYSIVLIASLVFTINFFLKRGFGNMFDSATEFGLAVLYIAVLILSIVMHLKLKNRPAAISQKICLGATSLNTLLLIWVAITIPSAHGDAALGYLLIVFIMCGIWLISLITGAFSLRPAVITQQGIAN